MIIIATDNAKLLDTKREMSYNNTAMKKKLSVLIFTIALSFAIMAFSGCVQGVASESDLFGSFVAGDNLKAITLAENNVAIVEFNSTDGVVRNQYFARYDLIGDKIELRKNDYHGDIVYTLIIKSADNLELEYVYEIAGDNGSEKSEPEYIPFARI
ncbi:MAG: hypothetical protein IKM44_02175 [Clostridia bacterium]|nr:hypothetical protein [Clostridia bacterium]